LRKPYIISEHWTGYLPNKNKDIGFLQKLITKTITKNASYTCPVSENLKKEMINFGLKGNYYCVPNVVDTTLFYPRPKNEKRFTIVHISTLINTHKNILGILNVISKLSKFRTDFVFKIIGESPIPDIQKQIDKLKIPKKCIQIEFTKTPKEISTILQKANLYVSFSNYETFGIVMCEALACGVPVISTRTGILNELNFSDMIKLISIADEQALSNQIIGFLDNDYCFNTEQMYFQIQNLFSVKKISEEFSEIYFKSINS
jgi:glycosyltransferase involved in cell wall biosynthesis